MWTALPGTDGEYRPAWPSPGGPGAVMEEPMWTALPGTDPMPPPARPGPGPAMEEPMWTAFPSIDAGAGAALDRPKTAVFFLNHGWFMNGVRSHPPKHAMF